MNGEARFVQPDLIGLTISITANINQWHALAEQFNAKSSAWEFANVIRALLKEKLRTARRE